MSCGLILMSCMMTCQAQLQSAPHPQRRAVYLQSQKQHMQQERQPANPKHILRRS